MPSIIFQKLCFHYENPYAEVFSDLDLLIDTDWRTGLVGRNGVGKSTLLALIRGDEQPGSGHLEVPVATRAFPPAGLDTTASVRQVMREAVLPYRAMSRRMDKLLMQASDEAIAEYGRLQERFQLLGGYEINARVEAESDTLDLSATKLDRPFSSLSGGEQTRALIAALFSSDAGYVLIDEPTNHLDASGRQMLSDYLQAKQGFLLVSHDRAFLDKTVDHIVAVNRSDIRVTRGNFSSWRQHMDEELEHELRTRSKIEQEVKQLRRAALERRESAHARERDKYGEATSGSRDTGFIGHRAAKQMKRALASERRIDNRLEEKRGLLRNQEKQRKLYIETAGGLPGSLVTASGIAATRGDRELFRSVSFELKCGERIAVTGANGCGKTTLLDAVCGAADTSAGLITRRRGLRVSRVLQQPAWTSGYLRSRLQAAGMEETRFRQLLGVLGVSGEIFDRNLETFSEGQCKKVELVRSLMEDADLLLWDEPLNYIDLLSREQIEQAVLAGQPTMLFVEHDRHFTRRVATGVLHLDQGSSTPPSTSTVVPVM